MNEMKTKLNRRTFLNSITGIAAASTIAGPTVVISNSSRAATKISFVSFGGSYGDFVKENWIPPFTKETGIEVEYLSGPDLAKVRAQVNAKSVEWDVFDAPGSTAYAGSKEGLWEPIDTKIVDMNKFVQKGSPDMAPTFIYSGGIAYDPRRTKPAALTFPQLWDSKGFPGGRAFRTRVSETLEMALLADGVEPSKLYPLDVDRGFKALDRIKPFVKKWFEQTPQGITLVQTGEADYSYTYANRVKAASESGVSMAFSFDQVLSALNYYTVPRGSPRKEAAMKFIQFVTSPDMQALMSNKMGLVPVTKGAEAKVIPDVKKWLPDFNNPKNAFINDEYWRDNYVALDKRFKEWIIL